MAVDPFPAWLISPLWLIFWRFGLFERRMMGSKASFYFLSQQWLQYCEKMDVVTRERWRSIVAGCKLLHYLTWSAFNVGTEKEKKAGNCRGFFKACGAKAAIVTLASHNNFQIDFPVWIFWVGSPKITIFTKLRNFSFNCFQESKMNMTLIVKVHLHAVTGSKSGINQVVDNKRGWWGDGRMARAKSR